MVYELPNKTFAEITNDVEEEKYNNNTKLPWLFLGECGRRLRKFYNISKKIPLIILKYGHIDNQYTYQNYLEYELYHPITYQKLNLSICQNTNVGMVINTKMDDDLADTLGNIMEQGYDPFDINDKFYREICTPYDSENGTDVLLDDREEYYYSSLNTIVCPDGCGTSSYSLDTRYLKCDCPVDEDDITLDIKHMSGENVEQSFKSTLKNSNWKVMICYNLVFDKDVFAHNAGSILCLIFFIIYVGFFVYYIFEGITPLQDKIAQIMSDEEEEKNKEEEAKSKGKNGKKNDKKEENEENKDKKENDAVITFKNPPKKYLSRKDDNKDKDKDKDKDSADITIVRKTDNIKIVSLKNNRNKKLITAPGLTEKDLSKL